MATFTYVYCVVKSLRRPSTSRAPKGVPGAGTPRVVPAPRGTWLIVADVPSDLYGEDTINEHLKDLEWVTVRAMAHEAMVEHVARRADVVPMKLFTIFHSDARAVTDVAASASLPAIFRKISGCDEWGIRVSRAADDGQARSDRLERERRALSGTAFLLEKKRERDHSRASAAASRRIAEEAYRALSKLARDSVRKDADLPGTVVLLDAALLVPRARRKSLAAAAKQQARAAGSVGCELSLTGPWPAYHFVGR
jgi:hypothetical protein